MDDDLPLAAEFPPATREQWRELVEAVLEKRPHDRTLISHTYDGLAIEPLQVRRADAHPLAGRAAGLAWQIMQRVDHPDPSVANTEALHELENGANGLALVFAGSIGAYGYGLDASEPAIARALDGVHLDADIVLDLDLGPHCYETGQLLASLVQQRGIAPAATRIRFGFDPIGAAAASGGSPLPWDQFVPTFIRAVTKLAAQGFRGPFAQADGRLIHNAGGSEAQELAYVLAAALAYLRALESGGRGLDAARAMIYFRLAADADQFLTVAKFRALRKLWARVENACGLTPKPAFLAAETAWRMMTRRDPYVNLLRATLAVFSAALGGADAVTVLPFTMALGLPDRFARRLARNTQLILIEEANLAKVGDPAAGAGGIEDLTDQLCVAAWGLFQDVEKAGGAMAAIEGSLVRTAVAAVRAKREHAVARRLEALTGTSDFPHITEGPVSVLDVPPAMLAPAGAALSKIAPLPPIRLAEPFERLRDRSDRHLARIGERPRIFLANLGTPADFAARASFAKNLFEAGGIETAANDGFATQDEMIESFKASGAKLACLCSSDAVYEQKGVSTVEALSAAGAAVWIAGRPARLETAFRRAGATGFVFSGCDALSALETAHAAIEPALG